MVNLEAKRQKGLSHFEWEVMELGIRDPRYLVPGVSGLAKKSKLVVCH